MDEQEKPRPNTPLILLTMFNLLAAVAGSAPFAMAALITSNSTPNSNTTLLFSVPAVAVVLVITAWIYEMNGKPKAARRIAIVPLLWATAVLFISLSAKV